MYSDGLTGAIYLDKPAEIEAYEDVWASIHAASLDEAASQKLRKP
ncbi:MAG TPA: Scr1 family TA system antitoxin-like transcriptional regulator [Pilimelia sp.]|nr:Scr1 family TA system antitoxin-like transcriptional regulator [Pilimelia sp.]